MDKKYNQLPTLVKCNLCGFLDVSPIYAAGQSIIVSGVMTNCRRCGNFLSVDFRIDELGNFNSFAGFTNTVFYVEARQAIIQPGITTDDLLFLYNALQEQICSVNFDITALTAKLAASGNKFHKFVGFMNEYFEQYWSGISAVLSGIAAMVAAYYAIKAYNAAKSAKNPSSIQMPPAFQDNPYYEQALEYELYKLRNSRNI